MLSIITQHVTINLFNDILYYIFKSKIKYLK